LRKLVFIALFIFSGNLTATHIVGGEMTYKYLGNNKYRLRLDLFIDCLNGSSGAISQDAFAYFAIFDGNTRNYIENHVVQRKGPKRLEKVFYNCLKRAPNACADAYYYEIDVTLPDRKGGYYVSFQRCCRNRTITNLLNPGATGANYWTQIPELAILGAKKHNTSAVFKELPPNFICTNTYLDFDHSATDADGDSLVYELFNPFLGGDNRNNTRPSISVQFEKPNFTEVTFKSPYTAKVPILGTPNISINYKTGRLTVNPSVTGQFVVGILVKEIRNNIVIGITRRDYQFNIQDCEFNLVASYFNPSEICDYEYQFQNRSVGATQYFWDFGVLDQTGDTSRSSFPKFKYTDTGTYQIKLIAINDDCTDTTLESIRVVEPIKPTIPEDTFFCEGQNVFLTIPQNNQEYLWSNGSKSQTTVFSEPGQYTAAIKYKSCIWYDTIDIIEDKPRLKIIGDTFYCSYDAFTRELYVPDSSVTYSSIKWSTGDTGYKIKVNSTGDYIASAFSKLQCPSKDTASIVPYPDIILPQLDTLVCPHTSVVFDSEITNGDVYWNKAIGGRTFTTSNPQIINLKIVRGLCSKEKDYTLKNYPFEFELGEDLRFCESIDTLLKLNDPRFTNINWNGEVNGRTYRLLQPGKVIVNLTNQYNCLESDSLNVNLFYNPALNMRSDTTVCVAINPVLDGGDDMERYNWNTGEMSQTILAMNEGLYWVRILSKNGCFSQDSVYITKDPDLYPNIAYMPNVFSPNNNGLNDVFPDNKFHDVGVSYSVKLYNRWGEKLADYTTTEANWDGNINGEPAADGVYAYRITYIGCNNKLYRKSGSFHLMR